MSALGRAIKAARLNTNMTQQELSNRCNISVRAVRKTERGETKWPRDATIRLLEKALGYPFLHLRDSEEVESELELDKPWSPDTQLWQQVLYDRLIEDGGKPWKVDEVELIRLSDHTVKATICRREPAIEAEKEWGFMGRWEDGIIFGHYWRTKGQGSSGVILLRETPDSKIYRGFYGKMHKKYLNSREDRIHMPIITLDWTFQRFS